MTRSAGQTGLITEGSPSRDFTASRMAAKSTTAGTPLEGGREGGREGGEGREGGREGERERGREGGKERGRAYYNAYTVPPCRAMHLYELSSSLLPPPSSLSPLPPSLLT